MFPQAWVTVSLHKGCLLRHHEIDEEGEREWIISVPIGGNLKKTIAILLLNSLFDWWISYQLTITRYGWKNPKDNRICYSEVVRFAFRILWISASGMLNGVEHLRNFSEEVWGFTKLSQQEFPELLQSQALNKHYITLDLGISPVMVPWVHRPLLLFFWRFRRSLGWTPRGA